MFTVIIERVFEASHAVMMPDGEMEHFHCHEWHLKAAVSTEKLDELGFAVEFGEMQDVIEDAISRFENRNINQMQEFNNCSPTTEKIVEIMYHDIKSGLNDAESLDYVELMESPGCWVRYKE